MAREPRKAPAATPAPAPTPAPVDAPGADTATIADLAAANYSEGVPLEQLKPAEVVPVAVSVDALLAAIKDSAERAEQIGIRVVGPQQGRRRAGRSFGMEAQVIPAILLGESELRAIDGDPLLAWSIVKIAAPGTDADSDGDRPE